MNQIKPKLILITGGVRSGKSYFAEKLAEKLGHKITFIATAQSLDSEMAERITKHRTERPFHWKTYEEPYQVTQIIQKAGQEAEVIIMDCLTLLISNFMKDFKEEAKNQKLSDTIIRKIKDLIRESSRCRATVVIVSNEVGLGLVPANPMGRFFRDILGKANQLVASQSDLVYLLVAGIPIQIKGNSDAELG